jgi:hypothetical protein
MATTTCPEPGGRLTAMKERDIDVEMVDIY